jgi:hypothetical protein
MDEFIPNKKQKIENKGIKHKLEETESIQSKRHKENTTNIDIKINTNIYYNTYYNYLY